MIESNSGLAWLVCDGMGGVTGGELAAQLAIDAIRRDLENLPHIMMICYLNGFEEAKQKLIDAKLYLKSFEDPLVYVSFKEVMRILRKKKYD